jgi:alpha-L-rhamnosidase
MYFLAGSIGWARWGVVVGPLLALVLACSSNGSSLLNRDASNGPGPGDSGTLGRSSDTEDGSALDATSGQDGGDRGQEDGAQGVSPEATLSPDGAAATSLLLPGNLRCSLQVNPLQVQSSAPRLIWELASSDSKARGETQTAFEILVASSSQVLTANRGDLWSSGVISSNVSRTTYGGPPLASFTQAFWKVRVHDGAGLVSAWSDAAQWTQGIMSAADWGAQWISGSTSGSTMPIFRRSFAVAKTLQRALVSVCGLGQYELRINGTNVSDAVLEPGWTDFAKTCLYRTFDVTTAVVTGTNAMAVLVGNGMYNVVATPGRYTKFTGSFGAPKIIVHLDLQFVDGTSTSVVTDSSWKTAAGPITFTSIYGGEDYDAHSEIVGWDQADFDDTAWSAATVVASTPPALVAESVPPVKVMQTLPSVRVTEPTAGVFVYDFGQNFSGWPNLEATGTAGSVVKLTPGELLGTDGTVSQTSMGGGPIWFSYTLRGGASESWHPRFSYTGFRYVQVEGAVPRASAAAYPTLPQIASLSGQWVHTSADSAGSFTCSDADVNRVHALIVAAIQSNLQSILTDCPQREKLGWLETSQLLSRAMMFNLDLETLYEQEVSNMQDAQIASGLVPNIAPEYAVFSAAFRDSPEWGSAFVLNPWNVYQMYGDSSLLEQNYAAMKRYVSYLQGKTTHGLLAYGLGDWYDLGPAPPGNSQLTSTGVTATGILFEDATVMQKAAVLLGNTADATQYSALATSSANAYTTKFWNATAGYFDRNSQTDNAIPLALGFAPAATSATTLAALVADVESSNYEATAGEIGFAFVVPALYEADRSDVLLSMLKQQTYPGYLYQIDHGATSLTEAWNADPASSQDHAMFGHMERWFWEGLAGLNTDESNPGFEHFFVEPQMPTGIDSVTATHHAMQGLISISWVRSGTGVELTVSVPVNTRATIGLPATSTAVTESGLPVASAPGVTAVTPTTDGIAVEVGSGSYDFQTN